MWKRILANIISIVCIIAFLLKKNYSNSLGFYVFIMPYVFSNITVLIMLIISLFNKPKEVSDNTTDFLISVLGANLGIIIGFLGVNLFNPNYNSNMAFVASCFSVVAVPFYIVAVINLGKNLTILPEANRLQTIGVYAISRHPLYITYIYWYVLQIFICQSLISIAISAVQISLQVLRARKEEAVLTKAFPEYEDYKKRVGWLGRKHIKQSK